MDRIIDDNWKQLDLILTAELKLELDTLERDNRGLIFPKVNGKYDLEAVLPALSEFIQLKDRDALEVNLMELQYLLEMLGDR